jgi:diphthamide synthase (EF-2-diphthine--ammonia ligase)
MHRSQGVRVAASGDIFVEKQRVATFKKMGFMGCFPLWERTTHEQIRAVLAAGIKAYVVCVDSAVLDTSFVGRVLDADFLSQLPPFVDPCGEHGEFHTFVYDGPMFREPIKCRFGEVVLRESLYFCDLLPDG